MELKIYSSTTNTGIRTYPISNKCIDIETRSFWECVGILPSVSQLHIILHLQYVSVFLWPPGAPSRCGPATGEGPPGLRCSDWRPPGPAPVFAAHLGYSDSVQNNGYAEHPSSPVPAGLPPLKQHISADIKSVRTLFTAAIQTILKPVKISGFELICQIQNKLLDRLSLF